MKKRLISILLALLLLTLLLPAALAEEAAQPEETAQPEESVQAEETAQPEETPAVITPYVIDGAGLLSDSEREALEQKAAAYSEQHQCALYIATVYDHSGYNSDIKLATQAFYTRAGLGWGEEKDGVILLLSMKERDYDFDGHGSRGETICGYESSWILEDAFLDNLKKNDWAGAFEDFLDACDAQLTKLENGEDLTEGANIITGQDGLEYHSYNVPETQPQRRIFPRLLAVILIPCLIALIVCSVFQAQMKSVQEAVNADRYMVPQSIKLRSKQDRFTHRTETRTRIESDSDSGSSFGSRSGGGGGGGSSFHSGGGFSGRSGKF